MNIPRRKIGITSVQAAQMYLDEMEEQANTFNMDALTRASLRRAMGFDFTVKEDERKLHVYSKEQPYTSTWCKKSKTIDEKTIARLVDACLRLKIKREAEIARAAA